MKDIHEGLGGAERVVITPVKGSTGTLAEKRAVNALCLIEFEGGQQILTGCSNSKVYRWALDDLLDSNSSKTPLKAYMRPPSLLRSSKLQSKGPPLRTVAQASEVPADF